MLYKIFTNERFILAAISLNIAILFILSFDEINQYVLVLEYVDSLLTVFFFIEMVIKIRLYSWRGYIHSNWNKLDFVIVWVTLPSLIFLFFDLPDFALLLVLRALRVIKFFRFLKFVPNLEEILNGVGRALKASVFVLIAFFLYNIIVSLFTCYIFKDVAPEYFGNALISAYSIFKMFTLEGWYDIPEKIASAGGSPQWEFFTKSYFIIIVVSGGIFGLSIVNAIFVDEMVSDNNDELERRISKLEHKIDVLIEKFNTQENEQKSPPKIEP